MFQRKIFILLLCLVFIGQVLAQTKTTDPKRPEISDELKGKTNGLLNALARETEQFYLPENRVAARTLVANLLWESDEKQARQLFQSSISEMNTLLAKLLSEDLSDDEKYLQIYNVGELRKNLLLNIAAHDPVFALSAFQTLTIKKDTGENLFEGDDIFELELAKQISENDPKKAYEVALKNLENGLGYGVFETLENIYKKDAELGAKLAREILNKIKNEGSKTVATNLSSNTNSAKPSATPLPNAATDINVYQIKEFVDKVNKVKRQAAKDKKTAVLTESEYKELLEILARKYSTQEYLSAYEVAGVIKEIDLYFPALAQAIRRRLANEKANLDKMARESVFDAEMEDKTIAEIIQIIEKKPVGQRDALYFKAAETVYNEGDILSAKELYGKAKTKPEYDYLGDQIELAIPLAMAEEGNIDEVRQVLNKLKTPEEKIEILTTLAKSLAEKGNLKTAKEFTEEARAMYLGKMKNKKNVASIMQLSQAYSIVEPAQSFSFLENNISFVNDIIAAGIVIDEFNEYGSVKDDELLLSIVLPASYSNMPNGVALIRSLAKADFDRTVGVADRFSRREVRFFARFRIAQALLDPKAEEIEEANQQTYEGEGC
jgi:uncharacterized protein YihD (DUF1040 family)